MLQATDNIKSTCVLSSIEDHNFEYPTQKKILLQNLNFSPFRHNWSWTPCVRSFETS